MPISVIHWRVEVGVFNAKVNVKHLKILHKHPFLGTIPALCNELFAFTSIDICW